MLRQKNYLALGVLGCVLLLLETTADSVYILSKTSEYGHQPLTSSTLKWLPVAHYNPSESKEIVIGGVENVSDEDENYANQAEKLETRRPALYVCRAMHSGVWVAGTQKEIEKNCTVTIHGAVRKYEKYELLENVDGAARISWVEWNKYMQPHLGAVYVDKKDLVARHPAVAKDMKKPRYTHYIGTLSPPDNFGSIVYVNEDGKEGSAKSGELLVETEPNRYELSDVKFNWPRRRDVKRVPRVLGKMTIENRRAAPANLGEARGYSYNYSVYWGRRHAILNGLNTTIKLINGTSLPNITWGMHYKENRTEVYNVQVYLEPGTAVNVTLQANYTDMEVPYTATLVSHYEDGVTTSRTISGTRQEETLFDVAAEFGAIYFLSNFSLVPTTTPPPTTTTELPTTTTVMTTTTMVTTTKQETNRATHRHQTDGTSSEMVNHDENMILPPKKTDISTGMQSDDGGPLSLKNKVEVIYGGATSVALQSSLLTLVVPLLLLLILHRIT
ncbi:PREDICTED: protein unzipped [Wasmannia auropunctata]|uniref:protein unzipped n=1 Tax=Wasmannia auropunctata TaxID=64793 RepID=UPI0005EF517C|nr:PREDICTED: protein unzipped [Wasmannia auropunctata]XP_011694034.1 PREDICTED: protein unzipped [Wasmannia auropunctata]XP_011694035.1 PREDICTED: protein unzipped [Wasmannia auropunctata]